MINYITIPNRQTQQDGLDHLLKITSLTYLKEALRDEAYEQCAQIINAAKEFAVDPDEVKKLIQEHIAALNVRDRKITYYFREP